MASVCTDCVAIVGVEYMEATETVAMRALNKFFDAVASSSISNIVVDLNMDLLYILIPSMRLVSHRDVSLFEVILGTCLLSVLVKKKNLKEGFHVPFCFSLALLCLSLFLSEYVHITCR